MPYIGHANPKLYQFIEVPDELPEHEKKLLNALILYRSAWAKVKQRKSFWAQIQNKSYFEATLLDYLADLSAKETWGMDANQIKGYLMQRGLFSAFRNDEEIKQYIQRIRKTTQTALLDFYFFMQKVPDFMIELQQAASLSKEALAQKSADIKTLVGQKTYLLDAFPESLLDRHESFEKLRKTHIMNTPNFWLTNEKVSEEEVMAFAPLFRPSELVNIIHTRKKMGLAPLPLLENANYVSWFAKRLSICGIQDSIFSENYLEILKAADRYLLNGGKVSFKIECLFQNNNWFSAMQQYKTSYEAPLEDITDLAQELILVFKVLFNFLFNIIAILTTITLAVTLELALIASLAIFFEPHNLSVMIALSVSLPGGFLMIPAITIAALSLMLLTASAATGILSYLLHETRLLPNDIVESVSRLGSRIYASSTSLFNQSIKNTSHVVNEPISCPSTQALDPHLSPSYPKN